MCIPTSTSHPSATATTADVVYLTGSSGFVGQMIVRCCESLGSIVKVYCPVREKQGASGKERFQGLFGSSKKTVFVETTDPLPSDVTLVILNAYDVRFFTPLDTKLKGSVEPMLRILEQCRGHPLVRGISVVSTAYVQNPLPFKQPEINRIPFELADIMSASKLYHGLVTGVISFDKILEDHGKELSHHHKWNLYAFSKHIMEHVVHETFADLPICIVRPAIVAPSRDGTYGHDSSDGFPLFLKIAQSPLIRFPRNEGKLNIVFVEDVASDIIEAASMLAEPATRDEKGLVFHPICSSTSASAHGALEMAKWAAPQVWRFDIRNSTARKALRTMEIGVVRMVKGKRMARLTRNLYSVFDPIFSNTWDYEGRLLPSGPDIVHCARNFYKHQPIASKSG